MAEADRTRWDARYRDRPDRDRPAEPFLVGSAADLPRSGRALDLAGGLGIEAAWLAARGFDVTLADISAVALDRAAARARALGLAVECRPVDLEAGPIPPGPWDLVVAIRFLDRAAYRSIPAGLAPGGMALVVHPTARNAERKARPSARHLLAEGELPGLLAGLDPVRSEEGWTAEGRHEARFLGRKAAR